MSKARAQGSRPETRYPTRNWREYDQGLIARGDLPGLFSLRGILTVSQVPQIFLG